MRTASETFANARNVLARLIATRPLPQVTDAVIASPLHTRREVDETMLGLGFQIGRVADYFARLRSTEAVDGVNHAALLQRYLDSAEGQAMLFALLAENNPALDDHVIGLINRHAPRATVQTRDRWHKPSMFSWIGALLGAVLGMVLGFIVNVFIDATPINGTVDGKQIVVGSIIDMLPGQIAIVAGLALFFGALGAALFHRKDRDGDVRN